MEELRYFLEISDIQDEEKKKSVFEEFDAATEKYHTEITMLRDYMTRLNGTFISASVPAVVPGADYLGWTNNLGTGTANMVTGGARRRLASGNNGGDSPAPESSGSKGSEDLVASMTQQRVTTLFGGWAFMMGNASHDDTLPISFTTSQGGRGFCGDDLSQGQQWNCVLQSWRFKEDKTGKVSGRGL